MEEQYQELKQLIIDTLNLEELTPGDISTEAPLFVEGLGLDSIYAVELGLAVKQKYHLVISTEQETMKKHFYSVKTLAEYIAENRQSTVDSKTPQP